MDKVSFQGISYLHQKCKADSSSTVMSVSSENVSFQLCLLVVLHYCNCHYIASYSFTIAIIINVGHITYILYLPIRSSTHLLSFHVLIVYCPTSKILLENWGRALSSALVDYNRFVQRKTHLGNYSVWIIYGYYARSYLFGPMEILVLEILWVSTAKQNIVDEYHARHFITLLILCLML